MARLPLSCVAPIYLARRPHPYPHQTPRRSAPDDLTLPYARAGYRLHNAPATAVAGQGALALGIRW